MIHQFVVDANKDIKEDGEFIFKTNDGELIAYIRNVGGVNSILREVKSYKIKFDFENKEFKDIIDIVTIMVENYKEDGSYISNNIIEFEKKDGEKLESFLFKATMKVKSGKVGV